jgi:hypothetical protein
MFDDVIQSKSIVCVIPRSSIHIDLLACNKAGNEIVSIEFSFFFNLLLNQTGKVKWVQAETGLVYLKGGNK